MFQFLKKHKNKVAFLGLTTAAGAGGLYLVNKYVEKKFAERQKAETEQMLEQIRRQHHFENTQRTADTTLKSALLPALKETIAQSLSTETILTELRNSAISAEKKQQLWEELKVLSFAKCVTLVICGTLLKFLVKIQLNILAGYNYQATVHSGQIAFQKFQNYHFWLFFEFQNQKYLSQKIML